MRAWPANPRKNDGLPVDKVAESIERFGFAAPIVARRETGEIIAGHTRWKAAQKLGLDRVPVRYLDITEQEAHLLALADNKLGELAQWDDAQLQEILADFSAEDALLAGWDQAELDKLTGEHMQPGEDEELSGETEPGSFGLFPAPVLCEALVQTLLGKKQSDFAPALPDVMVALNRCAAGKGAALSRVTDRWFPHRYDVLAGTARQTPNQQMQMPEALRRAADMTTGVMKQWGSVRELVNNVLLCWGQCARQFPIDRARDIYREFTKPGDNVLDPCAGWGGRLLGWLCAGNGGQYVGFDAGKATVQGFEAMITELAIENAKVFHSAYEDATLMPEHFHFAFTSPPYFTLERYGSDPEQAEVRYRTYKKWCEGFLRPLVANTLAALRPGGAFVLNLSDVGEHELAQDAIAIAVECGAQVEQRSIDIGSARKLHNREKSEIEDLLVLRKPGKPRSRRVAGQ